MTQESPIPFDPGSLGFQVETERRRLDVKRLDTRAVDILDEMANNL